MFRFVRFSARIQIAALVIANLVILIAITSCVEPVKRSAAPEITDVIYEVFPAATEVIEIDNVDGARFAGHLGKPAISQVNGPQGILGYSVDARVTARSGPFAIRVLLDERLYVRRAMVLSYPFKRGRDVRKQSFTDQFTGKGPNDQIRIGRDIDAMTGATISAKAMAAGVRDIIDLLAQI
jgi:hypothetical protein